MGSSESVILDAQGQPIGQRRCVLLVTPPSYEVSRLIQQIPTSLGYEYVSVGQMIRDEINKKTNYSRIILENLEKYHKINQNVLDILLKNAALLGNFIIKFSPRDKDEFSIWKKFVSKVKVDLAVVIKLEPDEAIMKRASYREKYQAYQMQIEQVRDLVGKSVFLMIDHGANVGQIVTERLKEAHTHKV